MVMAETWARTLLEPAIGKLPMGVANREMDVSGKTLIVL
jgi:hypothetical protein